MRKIKVNEDMKHSFKRVPNDACIGGIGCAVSEFAGVALKGICVLRTLVLVAAMVIGAASASAQEAVEISGFEDLDKACKGNNEWSDVSDFKLTADIDGYETINVERNVTLDLDGHSITISVGSCFRIDNGKTLTIVDNSTGSTKGSVNHTDEGSGYAIDIMSGCGFSATGISITSKYEWAVHNGGGTATLTGCTLSGSKGLYNKGTASVTGCTISGTNTAIDNDGGTVSIITDNDYTACTISGGINGISNSLGGTVSIGPNVSIKTCSAAGIKNVGGTLTLNAWPAFGAANGSDIWLFQDEKIAFGADITAAPTQKITVRVTDLDDKELGADDLPYTITDGYAAKVKDGENNVIKPSEVFAYYDSSRLLGVQLDATSNSEAVLTTVEATATGTCGATGVNDGKNVTWSVYDLDGDGTAETLSISKSTEVSGQTDFTMADLSWDNNDIIPVGRPWEDYKTQITSVVVGEGVQSVGDYSFYGLSALTRVSLGSGVKRIGRYAFYGCSSLASVAIPDAVETISSNAFFNCSALTTVSGASGVTRVGGGAFGNTPWFSGHADGEVVYVGRVAYALKGSSSVAVIVKDGTVAIADQAFGGKRTIISITLPEGLEYIGEYAFSTCTALQSVTIPSTVTFIGSGAFYSCDVLSSVCLLPETPPELGDYVFSGADDKPLSSQHFFVASEAYRATSDNAWYTMWDTMAADGWQKVGEDNASTADAIASGVSLPALTVTVGDVTTKHFNFHDAVTAAKAGYKSAAENNGTEIVPTLTLLENIFVGAEYYQIGDESKAYSLVIDLNGKTITTTGTGFLTVNANSSLALCDGSTGDTKGSIVSKYSENDGGDVIYVDGGSLTAEGITITGGKLRGIYNSDGTATVKDCSVSGYRGIETSGPTTISGGNISGTMHAIYLSNGTLNLNTAESSAACTISGGEIGIDISGEASIYIGSGVSIKGCSIAGIKLQVESNTFTALPTFGTGCENGIDIWLANENKITFGEGSYTAPAQPITISLADDSGSEPETSALPRQFTVGYSEYVKAGDNVIDPALVFAYHDTSAGFAVALKDDAEAAIFVGHTFAFAEGQTWMTWCDANDYQKPSGITAYRITGVSANAVTVEAVDDGTLPAYTPLLLMKKESGSLTAINLGAGNAPQTGYDDQTGIVTAASTTDTGWAFYGNAGNNGIAAAAAIYTAEGGFLHVGRDATGTASYVLRDGQFILVDQNQGLAAHRCLLNVSAGNSNARTLSIGMDEDVTGITTTDFTDYTDSDDAWYDLQGRRVSTPARGIYIQEGRKIVVK